MTTSDLPEPPLKTPAPRDIMDPYPSTLVILVLLLRGLEVESLFGNLFKFKENSPPPGYKHTSFRLIVPQHAMANLHWHAALRHAAFLSLRRRLNSYGDGSRAERTLWEHLSAAPVFPVELAKPTNEDADLTILASGLLVRENGHLAFVPEHALLHPSAFPRKVSALWRVIRVRHSGPGLSEPRIEFYFTVQPASHMTLLDQVDKKTRFKTPVGPTTVYKGPVYGGLPGQYYDPKFVETYRNVIQNFVNTADEVQQPLVQPNYLALEANREEKIEFKQEPIYIVPSPRLVRPHFPKVNNVERLNYPNPSVVSPGMLNVIVQKQDNGIADKRVSKEPERNSTKADEDNKAVEVTTKISSRYKLNSKKSDFH